jgi:hypothetical protein
MLQFGGVEKGVTGVWLLCLAGENEVRIDG